MTLKGRHHVLLWLLVFLVVASLIAARQSAAIRVAGELTRLREERATLEARQADLERRIREASSRRVLGRVAEQLGLHAPSTEELTILPRGGAAPAPAGDAE